MHYQYVFLLMMTLTLSMLAQDKVSMSPTELQGLNKIGGTVVSPNGEYVVYSVSKWDQATGKTSQNLWYTGIKNHKSFELTKIIEGQKDSSPTFSTAFPNLVVFTRSFGDKSGLYYIPFPSPIDTEPKKLPDFPIPMNDFKIGGLSLVFSAEFDFNCATLKCSADIFEQEKDQTWGTYDQLYMFHWDKWLHSNRGSHIFIQKLAYDDTNKEITFVDEPIDATKGLKINSPPLFTDKGNYDVARDGSAIAFSGQERSKDESWNTSWKTYYYSLESRQALHITKHTQGRTQNPKFSNDCTKIAYLSMLTPMLESENNHIEIYNILTNTVVSIPDEHDLSVSNFVWYNDITIFFRTTELGIDTMFKLTMLNDKNKFTHWPMVNDNVSINVPIMGLFNNKVAVCSSVAWHRPEDLFIFDLVNPIASVFTQITKVNDEKLSTFTFIQPTKFFFEGGYGDSVQGWVFPPVVYEQKSEEKFPTILLIHGGPESSWSSGWSYGWNPNIFTNKGYAVVMINPHGSTGNGSKFRNAVRNDWGGVPYEDIMTGIKYIASTTSYIDINRICAAGGSYGGYMVNWIQGHTDFFKCLITHDGAFSTISKFYSTDELFFQKAEFCTPETIGCNPFDSEKIREGYEKNSPERFVNNWKTPMLVIHGGLDYRVPLTEALSTFTSLQLKNVESRFLYFPLENHWVLRPENSVKWYEEILDWATKFIGV